MFNIESKFWKCNEKDWEKVFAFWENCIWRCCHKLSLLRREYLSSSVNVSTNSPMILHVTKRDFFQQNILHSDQHIWSNCSRSHFNSPSAPFTMLLVEQSSEMGLFRHWSNHIFRSRSVQKYICYEGHISFKNVQKWF